MAYVQGNPKTKKLLKEWDSKGKVLTVYNPSGMFPINDGPCVIEGPHYPKAHAWYAQCTVKNLVIVPGSIK